MPTQPHELDQIANMLAADYLALTRQGFSPASTIGIFGAKWDVLERFARSFQAGLGSIGSNNVKVTTLTGFTPLTDHLYQINVGYFLNRTLNNGDISRNVAIHQS